jgi:iron complex transport system ATP-binding protein
LAGLQSPLAGDVEMDGKPLLGMPLRERATKLALVLTRFQGVHGMSGFDSVALGRTPHTGWLDSLSEKDRTAVLQAMQETDTIHLMARSVDALSDGERQRLAVARALAQEATLLMMDEPTAFLDLPHRVGLMGLLRGLCRNQDKAVVLSTHDLDLAMRFADRMIVIDGKGKWFQGIPETLALDGVFDQVFSTEQVVFDLANGSFRLEDGGCAPVRCEGGGVAGIWTRRALRRRGWLIEEVAYPQLIVTEEDGRTCWKVIRNPQDERIAFQLEGALEILERGGTA